MNEISEPLNSEEKSHYRLLKTRIKSRMSGMWEMIEDLRSVRDQRLYRDDYRKFDDFLKDEVGIERNYANRLIAASETRNRLVPIGTTVPETEQINNESQLRELRNVPDEKLAEVVEVAAVKASDKEKPISAKDLREAREEILADEPEETVEPAEVELTDAEMAIENATVGKEIVRAINCALKLVKDCPQALGTEGIVSRRRRITEILTNAKSEVVCHIPTAICPKCKGEKCEHCGNHGWINATLAHQLGVK